MRVFTTLFGFAFAATLPGAAMAERYAAITFSPSTGNYGTAWDFQTGTQAETEAYYQCGTEDCDTVVVFTQCGALAVGNGLYYGYAYDLSSATAIDTAMQYCEAGTTNCQVMAAFCNKGY